MGRTSITLWAALCFKCSLRVCPATADEIFAEELLHLGAEGKKLLLRLCNASYLSGILPQAWLHAIIVALPKEGKDPSYVDNMRPISLTSIICKLCERLVAARFVSIVDPQLGDHQSAYRAGRTINDSMAALVDAATRAFHTREAHPAIPGSQETSHRLIAIFLDWSKAFDRVDHALLIQKLIRLGIPHKMVRWIKNFLSGRTFQVRVGEERSPPLGMNRGVPQGSVLGPLLFNAFVADMPLDDLGGARCGQFADDLALFEEGGIAAECIPKLQIALQRIEDWCRVNNLPINPDKCEYIILRFSHRQALVDRAPLSLFLAGRELQQAKETTVRLLGWRLDRCLEFHAHVSRCKDESDKRINHLRGYMGGDCGPCAQDTRTFCLAYAASVLLFGSDIYHSLVSDESFSKLQRGINAAARVITGCGSSTCTEDLLLEARLEPPRITSAINNLTLFEKFHRSGGKRALIAVTPTVRARIDQPLLFDDAIRLESEVCASRGLPQDFVRELVIPNHAIRPREAKGLSSRIHIFPETTRIVNKREFQDPKALKRAKYRASIDSIMYVRSKYRVTEEIWIDGSVKPPCGDLPGCAGAAAIFVDSSTNRPTDEPNLAPAGRIACSYRAEAIAMKNALLRKKSRLVELKRRAFKQRHKVIRAIEEERQRALCSMEGVTLKLARRKISGFKKRKMRKLRSRPVLLIASDSQSLLKALEKGPLSQTGYIEDEIWSLLRDLDCQIVLQFVYGHCDLPLNDAADREAKKASCLPGQEMVPVWMTDLITASRTHLVRNWRRSIPRDTHRYKIMGSSSTPKEALKLPPDLGRDLARLRVNEATLCGTLTQRVGISKLKCCRWCCRDQHTAAMRAIHPDAVPPAPRLPWAAPRPCPICPGSRLYVNAYSCLDHLREMHDLSHSDARVALGLPPTSIKQRAANRSASAPPPPRLPCDHCPVMFALRKFTPCGLLKHIRHQHPEEQVRPARHVPEPPQGNGPPETPLHLLYECCDPRIVDLRNATFPRGTPARREAFLSCQKVVQFFKSAQELLG